MIDTQLVILLIVCIGFMVYLGVEGFAQYQSYTDRLAAKYGLVKSFNYKTSSDICGNEIVTKEGNVYKTASDYASATDYASASDWQAKNMTGQQQNLYQMLSSGVTTRDDIRKMVTNISASSPKNPIDPKWLTYYDATDYTASNIDRKTGSRWNETSYIDTVNYKTDSKGGKHLIQCDSDDFACIRLLGYADPSYQPYQGDQSWNAPASPPTASSPAAPINTNDPKVIDCITKCLNTYGGNATPERTKACSTLCAP
jgi:hypothetical protein